MGGAMSSSVQNRRMVHVFCLKGQFPEMLARLRKKQAREGLTELELDNDASVQSHARINTIRNRARDWEQDWTQQPRAHRLARLQKGLRCSGALSGAPPSSSNTAHAGGDDWGRFWVWTWVCVCALLSTGTCLVGWQWHPRATAPRVVFKTDLVEFSSRLEERANADEAEVAHDANKENNAQVAHNAACKSRRRLSQYDSTHVVGSSFCQAIDKNRRTCSTSAALVARDTRFLLGVSLREMTPTDLNYRKVPKLAS